MKYRHLPEAERNDWLLFKLYGSEKARARLVALYVQRDDDLACWAYRRVQHCLPPHEYDDGVAAARLYLIDAIDKFDIHHPKQARFTTFACHHIALKLRNYAHRVLGRHPAELNALSYDELYADESLHQTVASMEAPVLDRVAMDDLICRARGLFTPREFACFDLRFLKHQTIHSVEAALGLTYGETRSLIRRVQRRLRPLVEAAGLME